MAAEDAKPSDGMSLFIDIFRRADKNDDGCLSWDEFKAFFADGVLSRDELRNLFQEIDTHNTDNIDTGELTSYFAQHLGSFQEVLKAMEDLNTSVNTMLHTTAKEYPSCDAASQFLTRFLLQQTLGQISAIQKPLDAASDALEEQGMAQRTTLSQLSVEEAATSTPDILAEAGLTEGGIVPGRFGRRYRRALATTQTSWSGDSSQTTVTMGQQVDRLRALVDRIENKVKLNGGAEEQLDITKEQQIKIVKRQLTVNENSIKSFRHSLRTYVESVNENKDCLHISVSSYAGSFCFVIYEVWRSDDQWRSHTRTDVAKTFQHSNIDCLEIPEQFSAIQLPSSWWTNHN